MINNGLTFSIYKPPANCQRSTILSDPKDMLKKQKPFSYFRYNSPSAIVLHDLRVLLKDH